MCCGIVLSPEVETCRGFGYMITLTPLEQVVARTSRKKKMYILEEKEKTRTAA